MSKPIFFTASAEDFKKIPGSPVAYWVNKRWRDIFTEASPLSDICNVVCGMTTGDNTRFVRIWHEISIKKTSIHDTEKKYKKWIPYNKGGEFRKWFGNNTYCVNWENNGREILASGKSFPRARTLYFKNSITWSFVSCENFGVRYIDDGFIFDMAGCSAFSYDQEKKYVVVAFLCTSICYKYLLIMNPTLNFQVGNVASLPWIEKKILTSKKRITCISQNLIEVSRRDWDSYENSWDFKSLPLLRPEHCSDSLAEAYARTRADWQAMTDEMKKLEEENNRIFIDAYGLQDELTPDVPLKEITLTCNPFYRYGEDGENATEEKRAELEARLKADSVKELLSYAIGCMMGRYSLDEEGLIYASAGNEGFDASRYTSFPADDDGIVPLTDEAWFEDDVASRFREFCKAVWGEETLEQNLQFVADQLEPKAGEAPDATIRRWLSTKFFKDWHLKTYKKRPIYWLFSSGKQKAFECLVYLHRYNENTLPRIRASYVTPLQSKIASRLELLEHQIGSATSTASRNALKKQRDSLIKKQDELRRFDDLLRHYADQRIALDLDDGVKVNYAKLGELLAETKAITGGKED